MKTVNVYEVTHNVGYRSKPLRIAAVNISQAIEFAVPLIQANDPSASAENITGVEEMLTAVKVEA